MALTEEKIEALKQIEKGADIYSYPLASMLRKIEKENPTLIIITKPMMYRGDGSDQMPYFGAICTREGEAVLKGASNA